ncbi:hypothetical protein [Noviherbaspirillum pedocola]|uniref:Uncharacterized protein n=1 Tax=Noviherbaspirillum pedocola TaxID=2801341 RepID=A0A934W1Y0_9BURK|nr:hypothetical protein [Noviherbaspirillum pedocola]MBK4735701.1 hypothetical protein [Noviherbaspirillum pedocola]
MKTLAYAPQPVVATVAPGPTTVAGDAFRRLLDREQMAALNRFRAVPVDTRMASAKASNAESDKRANYPADAAPEAGKSVAYATSDITSMQRNRSRYSPSMPPAAALSLRSTTTLPNGAATPATPQLDAARTAPATNAAIEIAETVLRPNVVDTGFPWPLRKLHCQLEEDGVHVWLRDLTQQPDDTALEASIVTLRRTLESAGYRLAGFTLNGVRLI